MQIILIVVKSNNTKNLKKKLIHVVMNQASRCKKYKMENKQQRMWRKPGMQT